MERILCPVGLDDAERRVLGYAVAVAQRLDARLEVLHVAEAPAGLENPAELDLLLDSLRSDLDAFVPDDVESPEWLIQREISVGDASREILSVAERDGCDLVIMGTHARGGLGRLVLGSVAQSVVESGAKPVVVVPFVDREVPPPPTRILVATDFSDGSRRALAVARQMKSHFEAEMHVLHVLGDESEEARSAATQEIERSTARDETSEVVAGEPVAEVLAAQLRLGAELVVVGSSGKGLAKRALVGSVAIAVLRRCPVPVLSVR